MSTDRQHSRFSHLAPEVQASACGKTILIGEHAVVYGAEAIAIPLKKFGMTVKMRSGHKDTIIKLGGKIVSEQMTAVVEDAFQLLGIEKEPLDIVGESRQPSGAGLGSSATFCISILRAIEKRYGLALSTDEIARLGNELEKRFHGNPSGLDTAVVSYEDVISFSKQTGPLPLVLNQSMRMRCCLIDSGLRASTKAMIQVAKPHLCGQKGERRIGRFDQLSRDAKRALKTGNADELYGSLNEAHAMLCEVGVVPDQLADLVKGCLASGAKAAKITGAGGGGCVLAMFNEGDSWNPTPDVSNLRMIEATLP